MSTRFSWREEHEEGPKTHANKQNSIPKPEWKWRDMFERIQDWIKCGETIQVAVEYTLGALDGNASEIGKYWLEGACNYQETTN